jgi:hypothetical protein
MAPILARVPSTIQVRAAISAVNLTKTNPKNNGSPQSMQQIAGLPGTRPVHTVSCRVPTRQPSPFSKLQSFHLPAQQGLTCCLFAVCGADGSGSDLGGEYARQRNYLEKTIESLKRKLAADAEAHRTDELRIMGQNVSLIRELNELRREIKARPASLIRHMSQAVSAKQ